MGLSKVVDQADPAAFAPSPSIVNCRSDATPAL